ncbi:MAG: hypothetical protein LUF27_05625 [Lachnospiraceae bacterium]|nr:hypothetical protein [Lachnospiraceae bacterium]
MMYEYRGSHFKLEEVQSWSRKGTHYQITDIRTESSDLWLPDTYGSGRVDSLDMRDDRVLPIDRHAKERSYPEVRVLHIPKGITEFRIRNDLFPKLERVEIDEENEIFSTDGRLIFAKESGNYYGKKEKWLKYCPVCRGDVIEIPNDVKGISAKAFSGTQYRQICFPEEEIDIDLKAFDGSVWLDGAVYPIVIGICCIRLIRRQNAWKFPGWYAGFMPDFLTGAVR